MYPYMYRVSIYTYLYYFINNRSMLKHRDSRGEKIILRGRGGTV